MTDCLQDEIGIFNCRKQQQQEDGWSVAYCDAERTVFKNINILLVHFHKVKKISNYMLVDNCHCCKITVIVAQKIYKQLITAIAARFVSYKKTEGNHY